MSQEAITEIDMEIFSRRIGPYFSWLESRIESGWQQSESVPKDVLKEVKYLATTMRARFILGVSKEDFTKEVKRTLDLFELSMEAFPQENDEIESKQKHFCKGISEELGQQFLPAEYHVPMPRPPEPHPFPPSPEPEPMPGPDPLEPDAPDEEKISVKTPEKKIKAQEPKIEKPKIQKTAIVKKPVKNKPKAIKAKPKRSKKNFLVRWVRNFIYGED